VPLLFPIAALAALVLVASSSGGSGGAQGEGPSSAGLVDMRGVMAAASLPEDWQIFLAAVAWGESKWHNDVGLGPNDHPGRPPWCRPSNASAALQRVEADAAAAMYRRNRSRFAGSPWPPERYTWGSGGWFGLLPTVGVINGFYATPEWIPQVDPWDVCDPVVSVVMAVGLARGLTRWEQFGAGGGTWLALRVGWGRPGSMDSADAHARMRGKFGEALDALGVPASFMDRRPSSLQQLPKGAGLLRLIEGGLGLEPDEMQEAA
jgi:hypothetical protein